METNGTPLSPAGLGAGPGSNIQRSEGDKGSLVMSWQSEDKELSPLR